ncbi:MAG TPA: hypothetical protein VFQ05_07115 [Candidatus Eisenbacteria bacterium]|nr:hypothetical protein [Candidatus Eisenbacteria bacterium]
MNAWKASSGRKPSRPVSPTLILALVTTVLSGFLFVRLQMAERQVQATRSWTGSVMDSLATLVEAPPPPAGPQGRDSVYWQWVATTASMRARRLQGQLQEVHEGRGNLLSEGDLAALREAGLRDPGRQIRDSLMTRLDLIPFKSALGGRMRFSRDRIILLDRPYVFAYAEDGHVGGFVLLAYNVKPDRISWRRIWWAELDG